mmetsp:Transcript_54819/g.128223  ORF Transcript_54819/g.128223 Transcript_54819/m.128223 type:complete len:263 (-) Transcript_54819:882-1670(-)
MGEPASSLCGRASTLMVVSPQLSLRVNLPALVCVHPINLAFPCVEVSALTLGVKTHQSVPLHNPRAAFLSKLGVAGLPLLLHHSLFTQRQTWHQEDWISRVLVRLTFETHASCDLLNLVHLRWNVTTVKVDVVELVQEVGEVRAAQLLFHSVKMTHVAQGFLAGPEVIELWCIKNFLNEISHPRRCCSQLVFGHVSSFRMVFGMRSGVVCDAEHVCYDRAFSELNTTAAEPAAQGLVDVFSAPTKHFRIIASCLVPPLFANR